MKLSTFFMSLLAPGLTAYTAAPFSFLAESPAAQMPEKEKSVKMCGKICFHRHSDDVTPFGRHF